MPDVTYYWEGNECTDITGGWALQSSVSGFTFTKNLNDFYVSRQKNASAGFVATQNSIDVTNLTTVKLRYKNNVEYSPDERGPMLYVGSAYAIGKQQSGILSVDVSGLTGVQVCKFTITNSNTNSANITDIWGE